MNDINLFDMYYIIWVALLATIIICALRLQRAWGLFTNILSYLIDEFLQRRYPIVRLDSKARIPGCAYQWPNGQGDEAKFLYGAQNSKTWSDSVLTKPEHVRTVFKDSNRHFKATGNDSGVLMTDLLGSCLGLISGSSWDAVRNAVKHPFERIQSLTYVELIREEVSKHFNELQATGSNMSIGLIDPAKDLMMLPFWIIARIVYGDLDAEERRKLENLAIIRSELFRNIIHGGVARFSWSKLLPLTAHSSLAEFKALWKQFNEDVIIKAVQLDTNAPIVRMFSAFKSGVITEEHLFQTLDEILFANLDVTTGGISWNLIFLAAHKPYQTKVLSEFTSFLAAEKSDDYLSSSHSLLAACVLESARLKPAAAFSVPQSAPTEHVLDGFIIPARTNFIIDAYALNVRNEFWGKDSHQYRPERILERKGSELRYHFWRFGFGPRQCLGKYLADLIIRATVIHVVREYCLDMLEEASYPAGVERNLEVWIDHPQTKLRCTPRQTSLSA